MGVTIHCSGILQTPNKRAALRTIAVKWAKHWKCNAQSPNEPFRQAGPTRAGMVSQPHNATTGVWLKPHPLSGPLGLKPAPHGRMQHFCKTRFAPVLVHLEGVNMLREAAPLFRDLNVIDEGGYRETGNLQQGGQRMALGRGLIERARLNQGTLIAHFLGGQDGNPLKDTRYSSN